MRSKGFRRKAGIYLLICILYVLFFPIPLGRELLLGLEWVSSVHLLPEPSRKETLAANGNSAIGFTVEGIVGFLTQQGDLLYTEPTRYSAVLTDQWFVNYSAKPKNLLIKDPKGNILGPIKVEGYPFVRNNTLFIISIDGFGLAEVTLKGDPVWKIGTNKLITSFDAGESLRVLGFWDGSIRVVNASGEIVFQETIKEGSNYPVYLTLMSFDDRFIYAVSGLRPQIGTLWERSPTGFRRVRNIQLETDFRRPVLGVFETKVNKFLKEDPAGIKIINPFRGNDFLVPLEGRIAGFIPSPMDGILFCYTEKDEMVTIWAISRRGDVIFTKSIAMDGPFWVTARKESMFFSVGRRIFKFRIAIG